MKYPQLKTVTAAVASFILLGGIAAEAHSAKQAYVTSGSGHVVRVKDRQGNCVRTPDWSEELATKECDPQLFPDPEPVAMAAPTYQSMTLSANALFAFDSATLTNEGKASVEALGDEIQAKGAQVVGIDIIGHTDSMGAEAYNEQLSLRRANALKDYLVAEKGIDAGIIDVSGRGESQPVADNATREGRARNRRVEVNVGVQAPK